MTLHNKAFCECGELLNDDNTCPRCDAPMTEEERTADMEQTLCEVHEHAARALNCTRSGIPSAAEVELLTALEILRDKAGVE